jgi:hypothetical protein
MRQGDTIDGLDIGDLGSEIFSRPPPDTRWWLVAVETQFPTHGSREAPRLPSFRKPSMIRLVLRFANR